MLPTTAVHCDICKASTKRCEYYPKGRSRQHGRCLECDRKDPKHPEGSRSSDPRYCYDCNRSRIAEANEKNDR